jgi:hypothetical protein
MIQTPKAQLAEPADKALTKYTARVLWLHILLDQNRVASELLNIFIGFHKAWKSQPYKALTTTDCWTAISTRTLVDYTMSSTTAVKSAMRTLENLRLIKVHRPELDSGRSARRHVAVNIEKLNAAVAWINTHGEPAVCVPGPDNDSMFISALNRPKHGHVNALHGV